MTTIRSGTFTSNGAQPAEGIPISGPMRFMLRSSGDHSEWDGGQVHILYYSESEADYQRSGKVYSAGVVEIIEPEGIEGVIQFEMDGAGGSVDLGWEVVND